MAWTQSKHGGQRKGRYTPLKAYKGDRVMYNGDVRVSDIDGNVWAPEAHGRTKE